MNLGRGIFRDTWATYESVYSGEITGQRNLKNPILKPYASPGCLRKQIKST